MTRPLPKGDERRKENFLFLKKVVQNPRSLGAIVPSSRALAEFICDKVPLDSADYIVEIGAGTGRFTEALVKAGVDTEKFFVVEKDPELCIFLRQKFPDLQIIEGDAGDLLSFLPLECLGRVGTVLSGLPLINIPTPEIRRIVEVSFQLMHKSGQFLQFTYGPLCPLPAKKFGLHKKRLGHVLFNFPPATVWQFQQGETTGIHKMPRFRRQLKVLRHKMIAKLRAGSKSQRFYEKKNSLNSTSAVLQH